jgi:predicted enzyme related to lactoylglutathione lyase
MTLPEEAKKMGAPPNWMAHVQVQDVDATTELIRKLGGRVYKEPEDIPTVGRFAVVADPQGAVIAVFHPGSEMTLHDTSKPQEFCWNELITSDSAAAFRFYSQVFGWKSIQEMDMGPMGVYRVFGVDDKQLGGMMTAPPGSPIPSMWMFYIETDNLESATAKATSHGAKLMNGPMDVPGGRITQLMDAQGAAFALHQLSRK